MDLVQTEKKPLKILWAVNILTEVDGQVYPSHLVQAFRIGRDTDYDFMLFTPRRMSIANARNAAVEYALLNECDYVYFTDDDMELNVKTLQTLVKRDKDIIMAMCYIRGYPYHPMVFNWVEGEELKSSVGDQKVKGRFIKLWKDCEKHVNIDGLIEPVAAIGCAATLIKTSLLRKMDYPWFYTGTANTEDAYFCIKAQNIDSNVTIAVDTTIPAGHVMKDKRILFPNNAELFRRHDKELEELYKEIATSKEMALVTNDHSDN